MDLGWLENESKILSLYLPPTIPSLITSSENI